MTLKLLIILHLLGATIWIGGAHRAAGRDPAACDGHA